jgi:DNA helicase-2/ATP-dependent DNA helicase PcrA
MDKCRSLLMRPEDLEAAVSADDTGEYRNLVAGICALWREYEKSLYGSNLLDFTALIELCVRALERDRALRDAYTGRFRHILVDEFQDTSNAQNELLRLLSGGDFADVMVVGDDQQSIYRWRDARVENLREFSGATVVLTENFRSVPDILALASAFINRDPYYGAKSRALDARRKGSGRAVTVFHPEGSIGPSPDEEARAVAAWVLELAGRKGGSFGDFAVLMRSLKGNDTLAAVEREFSRLDIPYSVLGPGNSLESALLVSLRNMLTLLVHPDRVDALVALLEEEPFELSDAALHELFTAARRASGKKKREDLLTVRDLLADEVVSALSDGKSREKCRVLASTLESLRGDLLRMDLPSFVWSAVERIALLVRLFSLGGTRATFDNMTRQLAMILEEMSERNEHGLHTLLEYLDAATSVDEASAGAEPVLPDDRVKIMTIHQAKGLEFPAVVLAGMKGKQDRSRRRYVSRELGLYVGDYKGREPDKLDEAKERKESMQQEERCLVYVAMTRARDHLMITSPCPGDGEEKGSSPFFKEILDCLEKLGIEYEEMRRAPDVGSGSAAGAGKSGATSSRGSSPREGERFEAELARWTRAVRRMEACPGRLFATGRRLEMVTWRDLWTFDTCPLEFALSRLAGGLGDTAEEAVESEEAAHPFESGVPEDVDRTEYGKIVHAVLEEMYRADPRDDRGLEELAALLSREAAREGRIEKSRIDHTAGAVVKMVRALLRSPLGERRGEQKPEEQFYVKKGDIVLSGRVDRLESDRDTIRVIDYKSGRRREEYEFQVGFYCWALREIHPDKKIEGFVCYLGDKVDVVAVDVAAMMDRIEKAVDEMAECFESGVFEARSSAECEACEHARVCGGG